MSDRALAVIDAEAREVDLVPTFVMSVTQAKAQLAQLQEFVRGVMVKGEDYGEIPGTDKPTLLKPGAEKLNEIYGYAPNLDVVNRIEDWEHGFFHYEVKCRLISKRSGNVVAEGLGSCNSKEKRYADRWVYDNEIPKDVDRKTLKIREFNSRSGGTFKKYLWANEDIYTLVNTILKMAKKRALVDATLSATRSSGLFTQDVEDIIDQPKRPANVVDAEVREVKPEPVKVRVTEATVDEAAEKAFGKTEQASMPIEAMATTAQVRAIYTIARNQQGWSEPTTDEQCQKNHGCTPAELSKRQASAWITELQAESK